MQRYILLLDYIRYNEIKQEAASVVIEIIGLCAGSMFLDCVVSMQLYFNMNFKKIVPKMRVCTKLRHIRPEINGP